jgi:SNF family Na+-dependent transporter
LFSKGDEQSINQLPSFQIWSLATSQILFSLSVGFGSQLVLASYNNVNNNCHRDALLIGIFNSLTSIFAGIVVYRLGHSWSMGGG